MCQLFIRYLELLDYNERSCNAMQEMWGAYDYGDNKLLSQQGMRKYNTQISLQIGLNMWNLWNFMQIVVCTWQQGESLIKQTQIERCNAEIEIFD